MKTFKDFIYEKINEETIQQFIYSVSKEVNARSQARIISGLKSFFSYLKLFGTG